MNLHNIFFVLLSIVILYTGPDYKSQQNFIKIYKNGFSTVQNNQVKLRIFGILAWEECAITDK